MTKPAYTRKDFEYDTGLKLKKGEEIHVIQRHVGRSGMTRRLSLFVMRKGIMQNITGSVARLIGWPLRQADWTIRVDGCGMDMHFHTVYTLAGTYFKSKSADTGYWLNANTL